MERTNLKLLKCDFSRVKNDNMQELIYEHDELKYKIKQIKRKSLPNEDKAIFEFYLYENCMPVFLGCSHDSFMGIGSYIEIDFFNNWT